MKHSIEEQLQKIKPEELSGVERNHLWAGIERGMRASADSVSSRGFFYAVWGALHMKSVMTAVVIAAVISSASLTAVYADGARPGDFLFPVDLASERVQMVLAESKDRDNLRVAFAEERLEEVRQILKDAPIDESDSASKTEDENATRGSQGLDEEFSQVAIKSASEREPGELESAAIEQTNIAADAAPVPPRPITVHEARLVKSRVALATALEHMEAARSALDEQDGQRSATRRATLEALLQELYGMAEGHVSTIERVTIRLGEHDRVRVRLVLESDEIKSKFRMKGPVFDNARLPVAIKETLPAPDTLAIRTTPTSGADTTAPTEAGSAKKEAVNWIYICRDNVTLRINENAWELHKKEGALRGQCDTNSLLQEEDEPPEISQIETKLDNGIFVITHSASELVRSTLYVAASTPVQDSVIKEVEANGFSDTHEFRISNLNSDLSYYGQLVVTDAHGQNATSSEFTLSSNNTILENHSEEASREADTY